MTFRDFRKVGKASFVIGTTGVIVPFILGYWLSLAFGYGTIVGLVVGAALVATSISITALVLQELNKTKRVEARMMISAAVVDDVLGLAILGVIVSFITTSTPVTPTKCGYGGCYFAYFVAYHYRLLAFILPRVINFFSRGKKEGTVEAVATAACFGASAFAAAIGLSAIVGAFAAGMAIASSNMIEKIRDLHKENQRHIFACVFCFGRSAI